MLAGGAIVLFYMLIGGVLTTGLAGYFCWRWEPGRIWRTVGALLVVTAALAFHTRHVLKQIKAEREERREKVYRETTEEEISFDTPVVVKQEIADTISDVRLDALESLSGYGFVQVPFGREGLRLMFYPDPDYFTEAVDSLIFGREGNITALRYAPPYLVPYYQKEDYESLYFELTGIHDDRAQIVLNADTGRKAWVNRHQVTVRFWPDFLASVFAVHPLDAKANPVRRRPLPNADPETNISSDEILLSKRVEGDWIYVTAWTEGDSEGGFGGWLRWREGDRLLVGWDYRL